MLIDSHCHLVDKRYGKAVSEMIEDSKEGGVERFITIATSIKESKLAIQTSDEFKEVYATVGVYPHEERGKKIENIEKSLQELFGSSPKIVAVGECGIDISNWENGRRVEEQVELFEMQIGLALRNNLPLAIHDRNGDKQILEGLRKYPGSRGVIHCFASDWGFAKEVLDLGFYISFSAIITYPSAVNLIETVKNVPLNRFLLETDSPYLPPQGQRGETNTPKNVRLVAQKVAEIRGITFEEVCRHSYDNTVKTFSL
ncbi:MAG: TatD family hydrolase [Patescibacteria group bacterium]|jgi:TatD DNase family protein